MACTRYPNEPISLASTRLLVLAVIAVPAVLRLCGSGLFVQIMLALSWWSGLKDTRK
jgi:hypothetical protein